MNSSFSQADKYLLKPEASILEEPEECDETSNKSESLNPRDVSPTRKHKTQEEMISNGANTKPNKWILLEKKNDQTDENMRTSKYCAIVD